MKSKNKELKPPRNSKFNLSIEDGEEIIDVDIEGVQECYKYVSFFQGIP